MSFSYRVLSLETAGGPLQVGERTFTPPGEGEVAVRLRAAGINHRDLWIQKGLYAGIKLPVVPGSDGAGVVEKVGTGVDAAWLGRNVIINPSMQWGSDAKAPGKDWHILGMPSEGTFAEWVKVPAANLAPMPAGLTFAEAAALPLAGITAYRALFTRAGLRAGEKLLITGIGGGVALVALALAVAARAKVYVTSGSPEKLRRAGALGASGGADYKQGDWAETLKEKAGLFDCILDSAGGAGFSKLCDLAAPGGRLVFFGATAGNPPEFVLRKVFWRQLALLGTTMGSPQDFAGLMQAVADGGLKPPVDQVFPFAEADRAMRRMDAGEQFGKLVLSIP